MKIHFGVLIAYAFLGINADPSQGRKSSKPKSFQVKMSKYQQIEDSTHSDKFLGKDDKRYLTTST